MNEKETARLPRLKPVSKDLVRRLLKRHKKLIPIHFARVAPASLFPRLQFGLHEENAQCDGKVTTPAISRVPDRPVLAQKQIDCGAAAIQTIVDAAIALRAFTSLSDRGREVPGTGA
ncbi:hypothetical protein [Sinorhizobium mexicanum]|uniref:Uncharacterized protein n=1 Tax=Sinorhizobium mexicanum TaxID=375549 RepID=A0A859QH61_9HYPH|nr:hypothetical protein [Sinorhizobium mexicanum]MBP1882163.1 hypothetical protein [Sinorhizobium mexicanum]QLL61885.1 hypothetical protein FKV68_10685 [Sinorhizobium mexicanum]